MLTNQQFSNYGWEAADAGVETLVPLKFVSATPNVEDILGRFLPPPFARIAAVDVSMETVGVKAGEPEEETEISILSADRDAAVFVVAVATDDDAEVVHRFTPVAADGEMRLGQSDQISVKVTGEPDTNGTGLAVTVWLAVISRLGLIASS